MRAGGQATDCLSGQGGGAKIGDAIGDGHMVTKTQARIRGKEAVMVGFAELLLFGQNKNVITRPKTFHLLADTVFTAERAAV